MKQKLTWIASFQGLFKIPSTLLELITFWAILLMFSGVSGKSQIMFAIVFTTRYLDLFTNFISLYNTCMKVFFIASSFFTVFLMYHKFRATYDANHDTFRMEFLIVPVGGLSFLVNHDFSPLEVGLLDMFTWNWNMNYLVQKKIMRNNKITKNSTVKFLETVYTVLIVRSKYLWWKFRWNFNYNLHINPIQSAYLFFLKVLIAPPVCR